MGGIDTLAAADEEKRGRLDWVEFLRWSDFDCSGGGGGER